MSTMQDAHTPDGEQAAPAVCQVEDTGQITDVLAGPARRDPVASDGGRSLWVVHQVCDLAPIRSGPTGTTIRVHMRLDC